MVRGSLSTVVVRNSVTGAARSRVVVRYSVTGATCSVVVVVDEYESAVAAGTAKAHALRMPNVITLYEAFIEDFLCNVAVLGLFWTLGGRDN